MRQYLMGLAAAMAVATVSAPAMAGCGGCAAPVVSYSSCANRCGGYGGSWGYATMAAPVQYYAVQPQYYYVNQGPTYSGPGSWAPVPTYSEGGSYAVRPNYGYGYGYRSWRPRVYGYGYRPYRAAYRYGYARGYYGARHYGHRVLRRYY